MNEYYSNEIAYLIESGLYRELKTVESPQEREIIINGQPLLNFSSNNYLGLATHQELKKTAADSAARWGTGAGASRLISGNQECYNRLEIRMAALKQRENSLVYPTGYMTNLGIISALTTDKDAILIDRLNHASIIDGTKLSGARRFVFQHCDMDSLEKTLKRTQEYRKRFVVTDTIFSMDGDAAPLREITHLCEKYEAFLIVDEAHAFGVFGEKGAGYMSELGITGKSLVDMGTFSKAAGSLGGYAACDHVIRDYLINTSRSQIYTTALPPHVVEVNLKAIELIERADSEREHLLSLSSVFREKLQSLGYHTCGSISQIIPILIGENNKVVKLQNYFLENGIYTPAIRFPTVPKATARLRISITSQHQFSDIERFIDLLKKF